MKTFTSSSLEETASIAANWLSSISEIHHENDEALVVGLSGHLGAGKTAFVKAVSKLLGIQEEVTSPTFIIMKIYQVGPRADMPWKRLVHIDAYRLERREELQALEWEKLVADRNNLIFVEWPENVGLTEFGEAAKIDFTSSETTRNITISD